MYNTKVICSYHTDDIFIESDNISEHEKGFIREVIYRQELLDVLGIDNYNEIEMNNAIHELYNRVKESKEIKECINEISKQFMINNDEEFGLILLYSYDYLYISHICISEYLDNGNFSKLLLEKIKQKFFFKD
jgi:hypothetical protein